MSHHLCTFSENKISTLTSEDISSPGSSEVGGKRSNVFLSHDGIHLLLLSAVIRSNHLNDSRRSYQSVKFLVNLANKCPVAKDYLLQSSTRWKWAVDWLKTKVSFAWIALFCLLQYYDRVPSFTLSSQGPFKCYVTLFFWKLDPHPPPRNANNIEHYTFVMLFSRKSDTPPPPPPSALRNT